MENKTFTQFQGETGNNFTLARALLFVQSNVQLEKIKQIKCHNKLHPELNYDRNGGKDTREMLSAIWASERGPEGQEGRGFE